MPADSLYDALVDDLIGLLIAVLILAVLGWCDLRRARRDRAADLRRHVQGYSPETDRITQ